MALVLRDRVHEGTTVAGTGSVTLLGAVAGFQTFGAVMSVGDTCWYTLIQAGGSWETGLGTYTGTNTLARTTVFESSNSGALVSFSAGSKDIFIGLPAGQFRVPTTQSLTSGTTYTPTSARVKWIEVSFVGGGGGGAGVTNSGSTAVAGSTGGTTTFNGVNAVGGSGGGAASGTNSISAGGVGGTGGTGTTNRRQQGSHGVSGSLGGTASPLGVPGIGGSSAMGAGATATTAVVSNGISAAANSGGGGGGALGNSTDNRPTISQPGT